MKIKVLKRFHDKVTGEVHEVGEVVEVTDQRGEEITSNPLGVAEKVGAVDVPAVEKPAETKTEIFETQQTGAMQFLSNLLKTIFK